MIRWHHCDEQAYHADATDVVVTLNDTTRLRAAILSVATHGDSLTGGSVLLRQDVDGLRWLALTM